jgi:acyl-CoA thioesterase YciA
VEEENESPIGELSIRTLAMPADTNPLGDIFGGWVLSQMDIAGGLVANEVSKGRAVTVSVDSMTFHSPVRVGDVLCCYTKLLKIGRSSMKINIEVWVNRDFKKFKVTEGIFTYVAVDKDQKPRPVPKGN